MVASGRVQVDGEKEKSEADNVNLLELSEATLLHNTLLRYKEDDIYTFTGKPSHTPRTACRSSEQKVDTRMQITQITMRRAGKSSCVELFFVFLRESFKFKGILRLESYTLREASSNRNSSLFAQHIFRFGSHAGVKRHFLDAIPPSSP